MKEKAHRFFDDQSEVEHDKKLHNFLLGGHKDSNGVKIVRKAAEKAKLKDPLLAISTTATEVRH